MNKAMTQVKFTIESGIVASFKAWCALEGVSMTSVVRQWMNVCNPTKEARAMASTRRHRRKSVQDMICSLNRIMDMESKYRDGIPEQFAQRYETADRACEMLAEAINCLEEAF